MPISLHQISIRRPFFFRNGTRCAHNTHIMRKTQMRLELKRILKTVENVELQSVEIGKKIVHEIEKYSTICVYLNMEKEVHTEYILKRLFQGNKNVFVPRVTGKSSQDMVMLKCTSMQDIDTFEKVWYCIQRFFKSVVRAIGGFRNLRCIEKMYWTWITLMRWWCLVLRLIRIVIDWDMERDITVDSIGIVLYIKCASRLFLGKGSKASNATSSHVGMKEILMVYMKYVA